MDKGEFIKGGYTVEPADGWSFVVFQGGRSYGHDSPVLSAVRGFSTYGDLLLWLAEEHRTLAAERLGPAPSATAKVVDGRWVA